MKLQGLTTGLREMPLGVAIDKALRKTRLASWRNRSAITVSCNGLSARLDLRRGSPDAEVVWQCFIAKQYEIPVVPGAPPIHRNAVREKYLDIIRSGMEPLIIDCGANIGASGAWFKMMYPESTIIAVEPAPDNFSALVANLSQFDTIEAIEAGIGPRDTTAFLLDPGSGAWGYQTSTEESPVKINMITLRSILDTRKSSNYAPFILKMDIEGAEKDLFEKGSYDSIECFPVLIFESHDFYMPAAQTSSPFFRFHADTGRDFLFGLENVFSIDMKSLMK